MTEDQNQSPPPEQARSLRRLAWLMFTPVAVLAAVGIYFLVEDRKMARQKVEHDTENYLQSLVRELDLENILSPDLKLEDGRLLGLPDGMYPDAVILRRGTDDTDIFPPPLPPEEPAPILKIPDELKPHWNDAERAEFADDLATAIGLYESLATNQHDQVSKHARYRLGLLKLRNGEPEESDQIFESFVADIPASDPLHRRAYWHLTQGFMSKRRTHYDPGTNIVTRACHSWSSHPDSESRDLLHRFARQCEEMIHNIFTPIVTDAIRRVERDDRARKISHEIQSPKWPVRSYVLNAITPGYAMVRSVNSQNDAPPDKLLVIWRRHQIYDPLWRHLDRHHKRMPKVPDNIALFGLGHSRGMFSQRAWNTPAGRRAQGMLPEATGSGRREPTELVASVSIGGFHFGAWMLRGSALAESNRRIAWFAALIISATAISGFAWRHTRKSVVELAALNEQKSNFVSSVSHELRAPVASMQLMAESLESGKVTDDSKRHEYHSLILQECRRLGSLVHNVLDYSRIEQRRKDHEFTDCNLQELVENVVRLMQPTAEERNVKVKCETEPVDALVDTEAIQQALINVIDNGIKFSPANSEILINLSTADNGTAEISVADQGIGIPESERRKVFERFYRRENELRRETKGVGIGLSIVHHIVEAHGGKVTICDNSPAGIVLGMNIPLRLSTAELPS